MKLPILAEFEIDSASKSCAGLVNRHIEPQVFDLIVHLVRNHDRIVSKDDYRDDLNGGSSPMPRSAAD